MNTAAPDIYSARGLYVCRRGGARRVYISAPTLDGRTAVMITSVARRLQRLCKLESQVTLIVQRLDALEIGNEAAIPRSIIVGTASRIWPFGAALDPKLAPNCPPAPPPSPVSISRSPTAPKGYTGLPAPPRRRERLLVAFDLETTGLGATADIRIREIGAVAVASTHKERDRLTAEVMPFRSAVKPMIPVPDDVKLIAPDAPDAPNAPSWAVVGRQFHEWLTALQARGEPQPTIVLGGYNSKRYDSRIWAFENVRHKIKDFPVDLHFVDLMEVVRELAPHVSKPRTLARFHGDLVGRPIASAHTALGDSIALRDIVDSFPRDRLWKAIDNHLETADGVYKRCKLAVPTSSGLHQ